MRLYGGGLPTVLALLPSGPKDELNPYVFPPDILIAKGILSYAGPTLPQVPISTT